MRETIDQILEDKIQRVEAALSTIHGYFPNVIKVGEEVPTTQVPGVQTTPGQPSSNTAATPEESEIIEKILNKIKDFTSKIQQAGSSNASEPATPITLAAEVRTSADDDKQKHYQSFMNWVKTSLKPFLETKQTSSGTPVDKSKIIQGLKSRISAELPDWKDFIFKSMSGGQQPTSGIVTSSLLFDETVLSAAALDEAKIADVINTLTRFAAEPGQPDVTQMLSAYFKEAEFVNAIASSENPKQKSDAAVKKPNATLSNKIATLMVQNSRNVDEADLPAFIVKSAEKEIQATAQSFAGPIIQEIKFILTQFQNYLRKKGKNIPVDVVTKNQNVLLGVETILEKVMYGYSVLNAESVGKSACGTVVPNVTVPETVMAAVFKRCGDIIVSLVAPHLGKSSAKSASVSQEIITAVLGNYFEKFSYVASHLDSECGLDELVYALTGNAPVDPYNRIVGEYITRRYSDIKSAEDLIKQIHPVVQKSPEMTGKFFQDYAETAQKEVSDFQQSSGISDQLINTVLKDKLLDESSLQELKKFIADSVKNNTENVDPEEKSEAENEVENFVEESGVSPEMTAVVVNSELDGIVRKLFSEVSLENQVVIASSTDALEKVFSYLDSEVKKIDKRYSKDKIMLLFDPSKGFYIKEQSDISESEQKNVQQELGSSGPMSTPGDEELSFPTGNEFGGGNSATPQNNTQPQQNTPAAPTQSSESEFEQALK